MQFATLTVVLTVVHGFMNVYIYIYIYQLIKELQCLFLSSLSVVTNKCIKQRNIIWMNGLFNMYAHTRALIYSGLEWQSRLRFAWFYMDCFLVRIRATKEQVLSDAIGTGPVESRTCWLGCVKGVWERVVEWSRGGCGDVQRFLRSSRVKLKGTQLRR